MVCTSKFYLFDYNEYTEQWNKYAGIFGKQRIDESDLVRNPTGALICIRILEESEQLQNILRKPVPRFQIE